MNKRWITGSSYCLGERQCHYSQIENIEEVLAEYQLPKKPDYLGLGYYYATNNIFKLINNSIAQTLLSAGFSGHEIDSVVFCSSYYNDDLITQNRGFGSVLIEHAISPISMVCLSGNGCVSLLSGVEYALMQMETQDDINQVLVINIDNVKSKYDADRFVGFAILSDNVSSVILCSEYLGNQGFAVSGFSKKTDIQQMHDGINLNNSRNIVVIEPAIKSAGLGLHEIDRVFGNNIFLPMKQVKELGYGFKRSQLYLDNVPLTGHCLGSDTLINFSDYIEGNAGWVGNVLLYAEADGHAALMLVSR